MWRLDALLLIERTSLLCLLCISVDALDSCENQTNFCHRWHLWDNNQKMLTFLLQQSLIVNETGMSLPSLTHDFLKIYFSVCVCQALGTTLISNRKVKQTKQAFPQINRDQSLRFDWMTKPKQQLKVCLMPIASGQLPKPKYQETYRRALACVLFILTPSEGWC